MNCVQLPCIMHSNYKFYSTHSIPCPFVQLSALDFYVAMPLLCMFHIHHRFKYDISPARCPYVAMPCFVRASCACTCYVICVYRYVFKVSFHLLTRTRTGNSVWFTRLSNRLASYFMAIVSINIQPFMEQCACF